MVKSEIELTFFISLAIFFEHSIHKQQCLQSGNNMLTSFSKHTLHFSVNPNILTSS